MNMEVLSVQYQQKGDVQQPSLIRPCVDCGLVTGNFCDGINVQCSAEARGLAEKWCRNQRTQFCSHCEAKRPACRFCLKITSCTPPLTNVYKGNDKPQPGLA